jgi:cytochrome c biogenesis protein CcmG, thiol:disulfide interchange protein DsbE
MIGEASRHPRRTLVRARPVQTPEMDLIMKSTLSLHTSTASKYPSARLRYLVPIATFVGLALTFGRALNRDPSTVPSPLIGHQVPHFALPAVKGRTLGLSSADLAGEVLLVNVFASWCVACRQEHPLLLQMKAEAILPIHGLNYKDRPDDAAKWLDTMGDPYTRTGADIDGRVAIDWGVYGVPETFVITKDGRIAYKQIGPITPEALKDTILPLVRELRQQ